MNPAPLLDGVTVLDLASVGPAARASRWLADYGAAVVKVGPVPGPDAIRIVPPVHAYAAHRGMRQVRVDLKSDAGRGAFLRMVGRADVVIESFRPGVIDRLGVGYEALVGVNPGIVLCSTTGYGQHGPHSSWAGHDLNYLAVSGYLHCSGTDESGRPALPGATIADSAGGGLHAVASICAALCHRDRTGEGSHLDVSIADGMLSLMALVIDEHFATGVEPGPGHGLLTGRYAWYDLYRAADGRWLAVAAIEGRFFDNLCRALGCDRWIGQQYDDGSVKPMRADFAAAFATRDRDDWIAELGPADACVSPVLDIPEVAGHPQFEARRSFVDVEHPVDGAMRQVAGVLAGQVDATTQPITDMSTAHTADVLSEAGFDDAEIESLIAEGVVA